MFLTEMNTGFNLWPHQCWVEGKALAQDTINILCCKGILLVHVQAGVYQDPQVFFCQALFQLGGPQHIVMK